MIGACLSLSARGAARPRARARAGAPRRRGRARACACAGFLFLERYRVGYFTVLNFELTHIREHYVDIIFNSNSRSLKPYLLGSDYRRGESRETERELN